MSETFPKYFKVDGEIFRIRKEGSVLVAEIFDKASSSWRRVPSSADVLWDGIEIPKPDGLPD